MSVANYIASAGLSNLCRALDHGLSSDQIRENNTQAGFNDSWEAFRNARGCGSGFGLEEQDLGPDLEVATMEWPALPYVVDSQGGIFFFGDFARLVQLSKGKILSHVQDLLTNRTMDQIIRKKCQRIRTRLGSGLGSSEADEGRFDRFMGIVHNILCLNKNRCEQFIPYVNSDSGQSGRLYLLE